MIKIKRFLLILLAIGAIQQAYGQVNDTIPAYFQTRMTMSDQNIDGLDGVGSIEMDVFINDSSINKIHIKLVNAKTGEIMLNQTFNIYTTNENLPSGITFTKVGNKCSTTLGLFPFLDTSIEVRTEKALDEISDPIYELY